MCAGESKNCGLIRITRANKQWLYPTHTTHTTHTRGTGQRSSFRPKKKGRAAINPTGNGRRRGASGGNVSDSAALATRFARRRQDWKKMAYLSQQGGKEQLWMWGKQGRVREPASSQLLFLSQNRAVQFCVLKDGCSRRLSHESREKKRWSGGYSDTFQSQFGKNKSGGRRGAAEKLRIFGSTTPDRKHQSL